MVERATLARTILFSALAFIGAMTLWPDPKLAELAARTPWWCLVCGDLGAVDVTMNVILFMPLGAACYLLGWPLRRTILLALGTTLLVETLQLLAIPGRDASLSDVITNTGGALLSWWLLARQKYWLLPRPTTAGRLQKLAGLAWLLLTAATAWGLQPEVSSRPYFGQWAPRFSHLDAFTGSIERASVVGLPLPNGPYADDVPIKHRLLAGGEMSLRATITTGTEPPGPAPIVALADDGPTTLLRLTQDGDALVFTALTRSWRARLRPPSIRLAGGIPAEPHTRVEIGGARTSRAITVWAAAKGHRLVETLAVSPNWSWLLVYPFELSLGPETPFLTGLWLAGLLLPLGYWTTRATRGWVRWVVLIATLMTGLVALPAIMDLAPLAWPEFVGAVIGAGTGIALAGLSFRREV